MPLLSPTQPLASRPSRVLVAGTAGAGKTTLAGAVSAALGIEHVEIDALFHGPGWTPRPSFVADVARLAAGPAWVTEWQYDAARPLLAERADLVVWLDLPRGTVMRQVVTRTVRRRHRREVLWNGNVEPPLRTILHDPEHIVRWAWASHSRNAERVARLVDERPDLAVVRLRSHREAGTWLRSVLAAAPAG